MAHDSNDNAEAVGAPSKLSVLFICLGNICRSPMAEAVFRQLTPSHPRIAHIDSAGTGAYHIGSEPDPRTMSTLMDNGIVEYRHAARKVQISDFAEFDYIMAMDGENLRNLQRLEQQALKSNIVSGDIKGKVMLFGDFGGVKGEEVVDPYYGARDGFEIAYEQMKRFTEGFIKQILDST